MLCRDMLHWLLRKATDLELDYIVLVAFTGTTHVSFLEILILIFPSYAPEHPAIKEICKSLIRELKELPMEGPWYSSIHPAWCFVIACFCVQAEEDYSEIVRDLDCIAGDKKSVSARAKNSVCAVNN